MSAGEASTKAAWARAFAEQALSDLQARAILAGSDADKCHRLHFLQMAAEKICKAHLIDANGYDAMKHVHCVVAKHLPIIIRQLLIQQSQKDSAIQQRVKFAKHLGAEIDILSPSCKAAGAREENSEYPWSWADFSIGIPCKFSFPNIDESDREFVPLIKLLRVAAESYVV
jgi:hypothetical protein